VPKRFEGEEAAGGVKEAGGDAAATYAHAVAPVGAPSAATAMLHGEWRGYSKSRTEGTLPRGVSCPCSDKAGNIYSFPLHIRQVVRFLLNVCPRQGHWRPTPKFCAAGAGGVKTVERFASAATKLRPTTRTCRR
jgi:hypothetical protein